MTAYLSRSLLGLPADPHFVFSVDRIPDSKRLQRKRTPANKLERNVEALVIVACGRLQAICEQLNNSVGRRASFLEAVRFLLVNVAAPGDAAEVCKVSNS